jgi:hypothetical protein
VKLFSGGLVFLRRITPFPRRDAVYSCSGVLTKVANLTVDPQSYWLYTNDPFDNRKRKEAFEAHGFVKGLQVLAEMPR